MAGRWKAGKSENGFPTLSTAPWKSRKGGEIPTFPQPHATVQTLIQTERQEDDGRRLMHNADADRNSYRQA
jgi:hypothetical protein